MIEREKEQLGPELSTDPTGNCLSFSAVIRITFHLDCFVCHQNHKLDRFYMLIL